MLNKNTLFIGKVFLHFPSLPSTNQYALELLAKSTPTEGTVISTFRQSDGRGQIGSKWESEPDKNLTLSVILFPSFLDIRRQFLFNQAVALGAADFLAGYLPAGAVTVKWPNDLYVGDRKAGGILIQNTLAGRRFQWGVAGIGINVNQTVFPLSLPNPTSMRLVTGREYDLRELAGELCRCLEIRYLQLRQGRGEALEKDYVDRLYRLEEPTTFHRPGGETFRGRIAGVSEEGRLIIRRDDGPAETFDVKEVTYR